MSDGVSSADVAAIRARVAKATPGPWEDYDGMHSNAYNDTTFVRIAPDSPAYGTRADLVLMGQFDPQARCDAAFIAAARTDVPVLLEALAQAEAENAALLDQLLDAQADAQNLTVENARLRNTALAIVENPHVDVPLIVRMLRAALRPRRPRGGTLKNSNFPRHA